VWQKGVVDFHLNHKKPINLIFAIPDHPWSNEGAAVRISMTVAELSKRKDSRNSRLGTVTTEVEAESPEDEADRTAIKFQNVEEILGDLRSGISFSMLVKLRSNSLIAGRGVCLHGSGFLVGVTEMNSWGNKYLGTVVKKFGTGKKLYLVRE